MRDLEGEGRGDLEGDGDGVGDRERVGVGVAVRERVGDGEGERDLGVGFGDLCVCDAVLRALAPLCLLPLSVVPNMAQTGCFTRKRLYVRPHLTRSRTLQQSRVRRSRAWSFDKRGFSPRSKPIAPATWGAAMEVPERYVRAVSERCPADTMNVPGAAISTHEPQLLDLRV